MAQKRRFLDVWIVESNTVYREVPFTVAVDWIQQVRLLEDDKLRWSGQAEWFRLGSTPVFSAYMPRSEPARANDRSEALEPVEVEFRWKSHPADEEDDVDMIPLIDVSLVLLIFFMMTTTAASAAFFIPTPASESGWVSSNSDLCWVGLSFKTEKGQPDKSILIYSFGQGEKHDDKDTWEVPDNDTRRQEALNQVLQRLQQVPGALEVTIKADPDMPSGYVRDLTKALESIRAKVSKKYTGVSEKGNP
jgi:biopolymer transport protein ExbD